MAKRNFPGFVFAYRRPCRGAVQVLSAREPLGRTAAGTWGRAESEPQPKSRAVRLAHAKGRRNNNNNNLDYKV